MESGIENLGDATDFEHVTEATMRAIALASTPGPMAGSRPDRAASVAQGVPELRVSVVPSPTATLSAARGEADALALWQGYHDTGIHAAHAPSSILARALFNAAERARVEAFGTRYLLGAARNIVAAHERHAQEMNYPRAVGQDPATLPDAFEYLLRETLTAAAPPVSACDMVESWRSLLGPGIAEARPALCEALPNQARFAERVLHLIRESDGRQRTLRTRSVRPGTPESSRLEEARDGADENEPPESTPDDEPVPDQAAATATGTRSTMQPPYRIFCRKFDEVVAAERLCSVGELTALRAKLDASDRTGRPQLIRSSRWLERRLSARLLGPWEGGHDEGLLDSGRLARALASPARPLVYRQRQVARRMDTAVTLLLDASNSMRGKRIVLAALCADQLCFVLDRIGVTTEILGYTTRAWKGGRSRERWESAGSPGNPGRLTDLRHIVFKSAATPYRRAHRALGLVLQRGLLKENVDGEALLWAHRRLAARSERRRILVVICDGEPSDEATLTVNREQYLSDHLRTVIDQIETRSAVELMGIGICHDVSRLYRRSASLANVDDLGPTLMQMVGSALDPA
ncbi:MAG: hypothetical protein OXQ89_19415 [Rhodospirillaceae bacterium]|nr:hypothetical protein [Rhodospirillaceae bacterium]